MIVEVRTTVGVAEALYPFSGSIRRGMPPEPISVLLPAKTDKCVREPRLLQPCSGSVIMLVQTAILCKCRGAVTATGRLVWGATLHRRAEQSERNQGKSSFCVSLVSCSP